MHGINRLYLFGLFFFFTWVYLLLYILGSIMGPAINPTVTEQLIRYGFMIIIPIVVAFVTSKILCWIIDGFRKPNKTTQTLA